MGQQVLLCVVDIIDVPEIVNDRETDEGDFLQILDWLDIWIALLDTNGMLCTISLLALVNCLYKEYKYNDERQFTVSGSILCSSEFQIYIILKHLLIPCIVYSAVRDREKHFFIDSIRNTPLSSFT